MSDEARAGQSSETETAAQHASGNVTFIYKDLFRRKGISGKAAAPDADRLLDDAELLLKHAAQVGLPLEEPLVRTIVSAGTADKLNEDDTGKAFAAVTTLAAKLRPVTAESLRACETKAENTISLYRKYVLGLGIFLVAASILSFVVNGLSKSIIDDIAHANLLAVTLTPILQASPQDDAKLTSDPKNLSTLQDFTATLRDLYGLSHSLGALVLTFDGQPATRDQLQIGIPIRLTKEVQTKVYAYQNARYFANVMLVKTSLIYGAGAAFLLPPLYAILGACVYLLKIIAEQVRLRTFVPSVTDTARIIIAAIGGGVVGLFSNFTVGQGPSLSPLAVAFLVGYASDVFFSFLDGLQMAFTRTKPG